jgi:hypothetical protein
MSLELTLLLPALTSPPPLTLAFQGFSGVIAAALQSSLQRLGMGRALPLPKPGLSHREPISTCR